MKVMIVIRGLCTVALIWSCLSFSVAQPAFAKPLASGEIDAVRALVRELNEHVKRAVRAAEAGELPAAATSLHEFHEGWEKVEDSVRDASPKAYEAIEAAYGEARIAFEKKDQTAAVSALKELEEVNEAFALNTGSAGASEAAKPAGEPIEKPSLSVFVAELGEVKGALAEGNLQLTTSEFAKVRALWPDVEGEVKVRSADAYEETEDRLAEVAAALRASDAAAATKLVDQMIDELTPLTIQPARYGVFDAAAILLREGLEALLIIAAILAFLKKSGNGDRRGWIVLGAVAGILTSIAAAGMITLASRTLITGSNRELMEGIISLFAAAMLFYVSYWMHGKARADAWQKYVRDKARAALATGSLFSLALLAFLSVFREGAETTLFYIGIMQSITLSDLLIGLGLATAILVVIGVVIIWFGIKLPMRPFFFVASLLVFYLGFKFVGTGIHALQVAGVIPANIADFLPSIEFFGMFPTWETTIPQLILLAIAIGVIAWSLRPTRDTLQTQR